MIAALRQIDSMTDGLPAKIGRDLRRRFVELGLRAGDELHGAAFARQHARDGKADALRRTGDKCAAPAQFQIHCVSLPVQQCCIIFDINDIRIMELYETSIGVREDFCAEADQVVEWPPACGAASLLALRSGCCSGLSDAAGAHHRRFPAGRRRRRHG